MTQTPEVSKSHQTGAPSSSAGLLSSSKLTFRQQEVFDLLVAYINQHGYPPTLSELADNRCYHRYNNPAGLQRDFVALRLEFSR